MSDTLNKVVIFGDDVSSLITAAYLAHQLASLKLELHLIFNQQETVPQAITISAWSKRLLNTLNLGEVNFVSAAKANFSLGQLYTKGNDTAFFSHSGESTFLGGTPIQHIYFKYRSQLKDMRLDDIFIAAQMAQANRFTPPSNDPKSIFHNIDYGYNLCHADLCTYFIHLLKNSPVKITYGKVIALDVDNGGTVSRIQLSNNHYLDAQLFIDCASTPHNIQKNNIQKPDITNIGSLVALEYSNEKSVKEPSPCSYVTVGQSKLSKNCQVNRTHYAQTYTPITSDTLSPANVSPTDISPEIKSNTRHIQPFYRHKPWHTNVIRLGPALMDTPYFIVDPLYPLLNALSLLVKLWPNKNSMPPMSTAFNDAILPLVKHVLDIDQLHMAQAGLSHDTSQQQGSFLELFKTTGKISEINNQLLESSQWYSLYLGLGIYPQGHHLMADKTDHTEMCNHLNKLKTMYKDAAQKPPLHSAFLKQQCNISI